MSFEVEAMVGVTVIIYGRFWLDSILVVISLCVLCMFFNHVDMVTHSGHLKVLCSI